MAFNPMPTIIAANVAARNIRGGGGRGWGDDDFPGCFLWSVLAVLGLLLLAEVTLIAAGILGYLHR